MKEVKEENDLKKKSSKGKSKGNIKYLILIIFIVAIAIILINTYSNGGNIETKAKISLDKIVEKSDLETANITYNVIGKKCKNEKKCDLNSNKISNFEYVVSCKGTLTAGIDFSKVKIDIDNNNKILKIEMPEVTLKGEPTIGSVKFLNGSEVPADELPAARKLCQETVKTRSEEDNKLLPAAKEQARIVLEEFYKNWIKAYDSSYKVEVK